MLNKAVKETPDSKMMKEAKEKSMTSGRTGTEAVVLKKMKQLELSWKEHMSKEDEEREEISEVPTKAERVEPPEPPKAKVKAKMKVTKKMALKKAAEGTKSILDWVKPTARQEEDMDWSDDKSIPVGESIATIKRKEETKRKKESLRIRRMCQEEVESLLSHTYGGQVSGWSNHVKPGGQVLDRDEQDEDLEHAGGR